MPGHGPCARHFWGSNLLLPTDSAWSHNRFCLEPQQILPGATTPSIFLSHNWRSMGTTLYKCCPKWRQTYHPSRGTFNMSPIEGNIYYLLPKVNNYELRPMILTLGPMIFCDMARLSQTCQCIEDLQWRHAMTSSTDVRPPYWRYFFRAAHDILMEITLENGRK
jgi:hypothetical protein